MLDCRSPRSIKVCIFLKVDDIDDGSLVYVFFFGVCIFLKVDDR